MIRPALLILAAAAVLRLVDLDARPMHADEAILADKFGELLASGRYPYNPAEYHGPLLAYASLIPAFITRRTEYARLTESDLRIVPAVAGILLALSPLLLASATGRTSALLASALLAVSPPAVYYSRFFIPETLLALWTSALLPLAWRASSGRPRLWAALGAAAGLMLATKETAVLALAALGGSLVVFRFAGRVCFRSIAACLLGCVLSVSVLLAPPWRWPELAPAISAYLQRGTSGGAHIHAWHYYAGLVWWILPVSLPGAVIAWRSGNGFCRMLVLYTLILAAVYSAIPYKTPWCVLSMLYGFCLMAGIGLAEMIKRWRIPVIAAVGVGCAWLTWQSWQLSIPASASPRNPLAYAQTGPGVFLIQDRVRQALQVSPEGNATAVAVYSQQNLWPLPWYFRQYPNVRWWRHVATPGPAAPVILLTSEMEADVARKIYEGPPPGKRELYMALFEAELRPRVVVHGYVAGSLGDKLDVPPQLEMKGLRGSAAVKRSRIANAAQIATGAAGVWR